MGRSLVDDWCTPALRQQNEEIFAAYDPETARTSHPRFAAAKRIVEKQMAAMRANFMLAGRDVSALIKLLYVVGNTDNIN